MEKEWVRIYETASEALIEMSRQLLEESGIDSVAINKKDSFYNFGEIELYVHRDNVIRAKQVLKNITD
jgi:intein/homing endonuclease